jgi:hypothetical protein
MCPRSVIIRAQRTLTLAFCLSQSFFSLLFACSSIATACPTAMFANLITSVGCSGTPPTASVTSDFELNDERTQNNQVPLCTIQSSFCAFIATTIDPSVNFVSRPAGSRIATNLFAPFPPAPPSATSSSTAYSLKTNA